MGLLYSLGIRLMNFLVLFLIIILLPGLPPKTTFPFQEYSVSPTKDLKGSLALNYHLDNGERLLEGRIYGPECIIRRKNEIFAGIHGGEVIKITLDHITHVAKFGQPCEGIFEESRCGRPLGLAFDTIGNNLIVADAYYGIWQVDLSNGAKKLLVSPDHELDGDIKRKAKIFNGVTVDKNGDIYWTDSSSDFTIEDGIYSMLTNPSGRLFYYNRANNISKTLMDKLAFPNGLILSPEEEFIIVAETGTSRLVKFYLKGSKKGQHETFLDGLPGNPDNLSGDINGLWVPLVMSKDSDNPDMFSVLSRFPMIRLFICRILALFETPFRFINATFPNSLAQKVLHFTGHFESGLALTPKRTTIVRIDWNGNILGSLHGFDKSVGHISHVLEIDDHLYLGSPFNKFIAKVKLPKSPQMKIKNIKYQGVNIEPLLPGQVKSKTTVDSVTAKPATTKQTTTPKPTTTTQRPTNTPKPTTTQKPATKNQKSTTQKTTTTTQKKTTTTSKPITTTQKPTTITPRPSTTTAKPITTIKTTPAEPTTPKLTTQKPMITTVKPRTRVPPKDPAPIVEEIPKDTEAPPKPKLKVIKKGGEQIEL